MARFSAHRRLANRLAALVAYLILIAPMSGLVPFGRLRGVVDRYTYVACVGWAVVAGGALVIGWRGWREGRAGVVLCALDQLVDAGVRGVAGVLDQSVEIGGWN